MPRTLVWIDTPHFCGWGCSECAWMFKPSGPLTADSIDEMTQQFERQREREFAAHVCAEHRRATPEGH